MSIRKIEKLLLQLLFVIEGAIVVTQVLGWNPVVSFLFTLTFPVTVVLWVLGLRGGITKTDYLVLGAAALAVLSVLLDLALCGGRLSFSYLRKLIMFVMTLLFFQTVNRMRVGKQTAKLIHDVAEWSGVAVFAAYILFWKALHTLNNVSTQYASFRFTNPNLAAFILTCMYMLSFIRLLEPASVNRRIFRYVLTTVLALFVVETTSRNGMLVALLFTVVALAVVFRDKIREKIKWFPKLRIGIPLAVAVAVFPMIFAAAYMALVNSAWLNKVFGFLASEGKKLNSRVKAWTPAVNTILSDPLIGSYHGISKGTGTSQMHNTHLDIAASYGIPVLILVCVLLTVYIWQKGREYRSTAGFLYMLGFCCTLMLGVFEAMLFSGGLGVYIFAGAFLLLAGHKSGKQEKQETL